MEYKDEWHRAELLADGNFKVKGHTLCKNDVEKLMGITGGRWIIYCLQGRPAKSEEPWVVFQNPESN